MKTTITVEHPANIHHSSELISHPNSDLAGSQTIQIGSTFIITITIILFVLWASGSMLNWIMHKDSKKRRKNSHSHNYDTGSWNSDSSDSSSSFGSYDSGSSSCDSGFGGGSSDGGGAGDDF